MNFDPLAISPYAAPLPRPALRQMLQTVNLLYRLSQTGRYQQQVLPLLPEAGRYDPGYAALMMGYDFHLRGNEAQLIEVNTNAGGSMYAYLAALPDAPKDQCPPDGPFPQRVLRSFLQEWQAFAGDRPLRQLLIIDEEPENQHLFPEMACFAELLGSTGVKAAICDPAEMEEKDGTLFFEGIPVDMIYNRHCDFYLESETLKMIRTAYLDGSLCLSPNPYAYGLLADKRRMPLWGDPVNLATYGLKEQERDLLQKTVLPSRLLAEYQQDQLWSDRRQLVFKPVDRFGGKGVLLGKSMSRKRFAELDPQQTLVQQLAPPSQISTEQGNFKADYRLFAYRDRVFGVAARLYQGQLTNLRTPGGGFARVELTS